MGVPTALTVRVVTQEAQSSLLAVPRGVLPAHSRPPVISPMSGQSYSAWDPVLAGSRGVVPHPSQQFAHSSGRMTPSHPIPATRGYPTASEAAAAAPTIPTHVPSYYQGADAGLPAGMVPIPPVVHSQLGAGLGSWPLHGAYPHAAQQQPSYMQMYTGGSAVHGSSDHSGSSAESRDPRARPQRDSVPAHPFASPQASALPAFSLHAAVHEQAHALSPAYTPSHHGFPDAPLHGNSPSAHTVPTGFRDDVKTFDGQYHASLPASTATLDTRVYSPTLPPTSTTPPVVAHSGPSCYGGTTAPEYTDAVVYDAPFTLAASL